MVAFAGVLLGGGVALHLLTLDPDDGSDGGAEADDSRADAAAIDDVTLPEIKGIGPAYPDRLADAGVGTVSALAVTDPAELAKRIDVSETQTRKWVERAGEY